MSITIDYTRITNLCDKFNSLLSFIEKNWNKFILIDESAAIETEERYHEQMKRDLQSAASILKRFSDGLELLLKFSKFNKFFSKEELSKGEALNYLNIKLYDYLRDGLKIP